jgi:gamma-glutamyltranspeptidase/glutathione hydrolase
MLFNTTINPTVPNKASVVTGWRQLTAIALCLFLAACSWRPFEDESKRGTIGFVRGFLGGVAADEPRAALIGKEILSAGGSAADAAVAVYFALAVTLPSSASLGGGGVCLVHDPVKEETLALDFLPGVPKAIPPTADRPSAIPANPRGFYLLHTRFGRLKWAQLVAPAARMARFGIEVSRALASDIAKVREPLLEDAEARRVFGRSGGRVTVEERDFIHQVELAAALERIRSQGPGDFYTGVVARQLVTGVNAAGGSLSLEDLRDYTPAWREPIKISMLYRQDLYFAPPPAAGGAVAAQMAAMLLAKSQYERANAVDRVHLFVEVARRAFADRGRWMREDGSSAVAPASLVAEDRISQLMRTFDPGRLTPADQLGPPSIARPESPAATTFVIADREGGAVACALTMNNLFGIGRVAPGTGIVVAALAGPGGRGTTSLGPMMLHDRNVSGLVFAGAATGGTVAPTALVAVAARTLLEGTLLEDAISAKRLHHGGQPDLVYHEPGIDESLLRALIDRGHRVAATPLLGRVNALACSGGLRKKPETCSIRTDNRGLGLAVGAD